MNYFFLVILFVIYLLLIKNDNLIVLINYFKRLIIFWLLIFMFNRVFFIICYFNDFKDVIYSDFVSLFIKSITLDLSFIAYLISLLLILRSLFYPFPNKKNQISHYIFYYINAIFIIITFVINAAEISLYSEWNSKLNYKALSHLKHINEVVSTASFSNYIILCLSLIFSYLFVKLYSKKVHFVFPSIVFELKSFIYNFIKLIITLGFLLLFIRGGWQPIPINESNAYFSKKMIVNDISVNSNWNFFNNIFRNMRNFNKNPYEKYSKKELNIFKKNMFSNNKVDTILEILNTNQPNIVYIILESWSADNIVSLGGLDGITPNFNKLEKSGLLFTNFYSNGWTSDQAITSIFSSFPVFPYHAIINQNDKSRKLNCINKSLKNYHSSFFFGGQLTYGNIKAYLISQGFDLVKDEDDYSGLPSGRLGVHDEFMFQEFKNEIKNLPSPFFTTLFTLSSHSPYDFPDKHFLSFNSKHDPYVNSVAYTDKCLGNFFESVKNEKWYPNTLFVIMADHSHNSPIYRKLAEKERFKIPMLFYGNVLKQNYKGKKCGNLGSQLDISTTILNQLGYNSNEYLYGSDLLDGDSFVPYAFPGGFAGITSSSQYAYSERFKKILELKSPNKKGKRQIIKHTEMFFQLSFDEFLNY